MSLQGREPTLWIDKYSIDQSNIENSLAALPVYLAGCSRLVILSGATYLQRLWCIIEMFVFMEMGGDLVAARTPCDVFDVFVQWEEDDEVGI